MVQFIIIFREVLEASLVVGIIYLLIEKTNQNEHFSKLWYGVFASVLASIAVGYLVIQVDNALDKNESTQALFEAVFLYLTAFLIWYVIFWLSKNVSDKKVLEGQALNAMELSSWGIFFVVFFAILREGFETAIMLISSVKITETFSYLGSISGAVLAILIGYLIVAQGRKVDLKSIFKYTTLLLVFLSAGMIAYGTHEAEEYLVKSGQIEESEIYRVWNVLEPTEVSPDTGKKISHPLHDKGTIGIFLKGFFGYNSNPNIIEVILWVLSMMFGLNMWRRFYY
ncbi:FTR1 family protein [Gammaproteobacteria bacterium]|nr:FTR1 family protein [Gammaproteobacteria bacterium]